MRGLFKRRIARSWRERRGHREHGVALILALICLLILTAVGIALSLSTQTERDIAANESFVSKAFYGADSGVQYAAAQLRTNLAFGAALSTPPSLPVPINSPNMGTSMQVTISKPALVGQASIPGYQFGQWFENFYAVTSTASITNPSNTQDRANKTIMAEIGVKPVQVY